MKEETLARLQVLAAATSIGQKLITTTLARYLNLARSEMVRVPGFKKAAKYLAPKADNVRNVMRSMSGVSVIGSGLDQLFVLSSGETLVVFQRQVRGQGNKVQVEPNGYVILFDSRKDAEAYLEDPQ